MKKFSLVIIILFSSCLSWAELHFIKEDLHFSLDKENFYVEGDYYLENTSSKTSSKKIFYPFPEHESYGKITEITVTIDNSEVPLIRRENGVEFYLQVSPNETKIFNVKYAQPYQGNQVEYILITTNNWHQPLQQANYSLVFPKYLKLEELSYLPDSLEDLSEEFRFYWSKENFLPGHNFIVRFNKIK